MNITIPEPLLSQGRQALYHIQRLPRYYHSLDSERKSIIKTIAATTGIFLTIGAVFGLVPFLCTPLGYVTPHIIQKIFPDTTDTDPYYLIGIIASYMLFGLASVLAYLTGVLIYKLEPITLSDIYLLCNITEPEVSTLFRDIFLENTPWQYQNGDSVPAQIRQRALSSIGNNINEEQITNLWQQSEQNISRFQYHYIRRRQDYRIHHFLQLLSAERREEFITQYHWPREMPNRNFSITGFFSGS